MSGGRRLVRRNRRARPGAAGAAGGRRTRFALRARHPGLLLMGGIDCGLLGRSPDLGRLQADLERLLPLMRSGGFFPCLDCRGPSEIPLAKYRAYVALLADYCGRAGAADRAPSRRPPAASGCASHRRLRASLISVSSTTSSLGLGGAAGLASSLRLSPLTALTSRNTANATITKLTIVLTKKP